MEKERRTKALLLSTLVVVVATLSIAFASLSRTLNINGIAKMDTASWSVYFDNLSEATTVRGASEEGKPNISVDKGTIENIKVKLSNPKDEISYTVDIVNDGTIDAEITMIKDIELTDAQKKVFEFKVTYTDTGEVLQNGDILPKDTTKNITINIKFKDDITEADLPTESQTINLSYQVTYTQYDGSEIVIDPDGDITKEKTVLAQSMSFDELLEMEDPTPVSFFNGTIARGSVESISFVNNTNVPTEAQTTVWDASEAGDNSITGWYQDTDSNGLYEVYIGSDGYIYAPSDSSALFAFFLELKELNLNNFNTSDVTNMKGMFCACLLLENLNLSLFNTSNVTDMSWMFDESSSLTSLDLSSFDTTNVTTMENMFTACENLVSVNVSSFNTSNVTDMSSMFGDCFSLTNIDVSNFTTTNVTDMSQMFLSGENLESIDLRNMDFSNVTSYENMFEDDMNPTIIVKDETQRTWITSKYTYLTNVVLVSEL